MKRFSLISFCLCLIISVFTCFLYYPKFNKQQTEATISWDVSGYYFYLPAIFIYKDVKHLTFKNEILKKYTPTYDFQQGFQTENRNYVFKYPSGQAFAYLPFFLIANAIAKPLGYEQDGFSYPYQILISIGALIISFIGLWYIRKILLEYFSDTVTAISLFLIFIGTNYLNYSAIDGAMTHNLLFTLYAIMLWNTYCFYKNPTYKRATIIGLLLGWAALTRPTDILFVIVIFLWGISSKVQLFERLEFWKKNYIKLMLAAFATIFVGSIQFIYWKYVSGHFLVYSYQDQGFSWLHPHIYQCTFGYHSGWITYCPFVLILILGFVPLFLKHKSIFPAAFIFVTVFAYVAFAWDVWDYGGGIGQRSMVQTYAVLVFPLAAFIEFVMGKRKYMIVAFTIIGIFVYINLYWTYQAHTGGLLEGGIRSKAYFWKMLGRCELPRDAKKLMDTDEEFEGRRENVKQIFHTDFETDTIAICHGRTINGNKALCLNKDIQYTPNYTFKLLPVANRWVRASAVFYTDNKEWEVWRMTQFIVHFLKQGQIVKGNVIRLQRLIDQGETRVIFIDAKMPEKFDEVKVFLWNAESQKEILIDDLTIETFE